MQRYYDVLGLQKGVSPEELKKTYRELSKKYHPDAHHNSPLRDLAEAKFKEINEAYEKIKEFLDNNFSNGEYKNASEEYSEDVSNGEYIFNILKRRIVVTEEHIFYYNLENIQNNTLKYMNDFAMSVHSESNNIDNMLKSGFDRISSGLFNSVDKYIKLLLDYGYYTANKASIISQYGDGLLSYLNQLYNVFLSANEQIEINDRVATAERKYKKAIRGLDNKGGLRNLGSMAINAINKSSSKSSLYKSEELISGLKEGIQYFYENLSIVICTSVGLDALEDYVKINQVEAILQNFGHVKQLDKERVLADALQGHPYNYRVYKLILANFGDENRELEKLAKLFNYSTNKIKNELIWSYEKDTSNFSMKDYDDYIGFIEIKGKFLGLVNIHNEYLQNLIRGKQIIIKRIKEEEERARREEEIRKENERLKKLAEEEAKTRAINEEKTRKLIKKLKSLPPYEEENTILNSLLLDLYNEQNYINYLLVYGDELNELNSVKDFLNIDILNIKGQLVKSEFRKMILDKNINYQDIIFRLEAFVTRLGLENNEIINFLKINPEFTIEGERKKIELENLKFAQELEIKKQQEDKLKREIASVKRKEFINFIIGLLFLIGIGYGIFSLINNRDKSVEEPITKEAEITKNIVSTPVASMHKENLNNSLLEFESPVLQMSTGKYITRIDKLSNGNYRYVSFDYPKTISDEPNAVRENGYFDKDTSSFKFPAKPYMYVVVLREGFPVSLEVYKNGERVLQKNVQSVDYIYVEGL